MLLSITYINEFQYIKEERQEYFKNQIHILIISMVISYIFFILGIVILILYYYPKNQEYENEEYL